MPNWRGMLQEWLVKIMKTDKSKGYFMGGDICNLLQLDMGEYALGAVVHCCSQK